MAAPSVTAQNTRVNDASNLTNWTGIGGGAGAGIETDVSYQGGSCISRKGTTGERGIQYAAPTTQNLSGGTYSTIILKLICTTPGLLDAQATQAFAARIGSANSAYHQYDLQGNDTWPLTRSWLIVAIDPNVVAHRSNTSGSPALSAVDYYALIYDQSGSSKAENQAMDAIDIGAGLTVVGGDGVSTDATWQDFIDHDEGTSTNRFGFVQTIEGILFLLGRFVIGGVATEFTDSALTIVFTDSLFAAGFSGITCDASNAGTVIDMSAHTFIGRGTSTGEDTRPELLVTGTAGSVTFRDATSFSNFALLTLSSAATLESCSVNTSGPVSQNSAQLTNVTVVDSASTTAAIVLDNLSAVDGLSVLNSGNDGIDLTALTATAIAISNITSTGSVGDDVVVDNASDVTLQLQDGSSVGTARNIGTGNVTISSGSVTTEIVVIDFDTGSPIENARVYVTAAAGGSLAAGTVIINALTNASGVVSDTRPLVSDQPITGRVRLASDPGPYYKTGSVIGTISNTSGFTNTVQLISDGS